MNEPFEFSCGREHLAGRLFLPQDRPTLYDLYAAQALVAEAERCGRGTALQGYCTIV